MHKVNASHHYYSYTTTMLHILSLIASAHVPTYGGGVGQCFTPPHHHSTSQVIYVRGSGGLEVHTAHSVYLNILNLNTQHLNTSTQPYKPGFVW